METLKLKRANRFTYGGRMYEKDKPFNCPARLADNLLEKQDLRGRPLFVRCIVKKRTPRSPAPDIPVIEEVEPPPTVEVVDETGEPWVEDNTPIVEEVEELLEDPPEVVDEDEIEESAKVEV